MNKSFLLVILLGLFSLTITSCAHKVNKDTQKSSEENEMTTKTTAGPPVYIYKTTKDYFQNVPVSLNDEKTEIVGFPDIRDVKKNNVYTYPTRLEGDFLLDNRGVSENTAFLKLTYEEYGSLEKTPTLEELNGLIMDSDPFAELYHCGTRYEYNDLVSELNAKISAEDFTGFEKIK